MLFIIVLVSMSVSSTLIDSSLFVTFCTDHTGYAYNLFAPCDRTTTEEVPKDYHTGFKQ